MIHLVRIIRRRLLESGSVRKYLIYAIGEILLVVIGILLALQINNWNEGRKSELKEQKILRELNENLKLNVKYLNEFNAVQGAIVERLTILKGYLENQLAYHDSLNLYVGGLPYLEQMNLNTASYESIKTQGFDLISSDSLRLRIVELHEYDYKHFTKLIDGVGLAVFTERTSPFMRQHNTLKTMWSDPEFWNLLRVKIVWKSDLIKHASRLRDNTSTLIVQIEEFLFD